MAVVAFSLELTHGPSGAEKTVVASAGRRGDSFDDALADSIIGLYKTELVDESPRSLKRSHRG